MPMWSHRNLSMQRLRAGQNYQISTKQANKVSNKTHFILAIIDLIIHDKYAFKTVQNMILGHDDKVHRKCWFCCIVCFLYERMMWGGRSSKIGMCDA